MITTKTKDKQIVNYLAVICLLLFSSCYQESSGCLDITASNYDASADTPCDVDNSSCECLYNTLQIKLDFVFDTLDFALNTKFQLTESDTLIIQEGYILLSNFCIQNKAGQSIKTQTNYDINGDGEDIEYNDGLIFNLTDGQRVVGNLQLKDTIQSLSFHQGLASLNNNAAYDFGLNDEISELIDSNYVNDENQIASFRIVFQNIRLTDTTEYAATLFTDPNNYNYTFPLDTIINYDDDPTMNLSADIALLFKNISLGESDLPLIMKENLKTFIVVKE